jgi:hypothetical protein
MTYQQRRMKARKLAKKNMPKCVQTGAGKKYISKYLERSMESAQKTGKGPSTIDQLIEFEESAGPKIVPRTSSLSKKPYMKTTKPLTPNELFELENSIGPVGPTKKTKKKTTTFDELYDLEESIEGF